MDSQLPLHQGGHFFELGSSAIRLPVALRGQLPPEDRIYLQAEAGHGSQDGRQSDTMSFVNAAPHAGQTRPWSVSVSPMCGGAAAALQPQGLFHGNRVGGCVLLACEACIC